MQWLRVWEAHEEVENALRSPFSSVTSVALAIGHGSDLQNETGVTWRSPKFVEVGGHSTSAKGVIRGIASRRKNDSLESFHLVGCRLTLKSQVAWKGRLRQAWQPYSSVFFCLHWSLMNDEIWKVARTNDVVQMSNILRRGLDVNMQDDSKVPFFIILLPFESRISQASIILPTDLTPIFCVLFLVSLFS